MLLKHRRILYICFFIIFFITAPLVILWAEGYRYDFTKHRLKKTGVLFLESKPDKAEIYLNNKLQKPKTTARLKNLLPNQYEVEIKKEGYQIWQKKLPIYSGQTTFAQYIRLFKENPEVKSILAEKILLTSQEIDNNLALIYPASTIQTPLTGKNYTLALFNLENQNLNELTSLIYQPQEIIFSPNKLFIFLKYGPEYLKDQWIFNINNQELIDLQEITLQKIKHLKWVPNTRDEIIYVISKNGLEKINLISQEITTLLKKSMLDFYITDNQIFFLEKTEDIVLLNQTSFNNLDESKIITTLPISDDYKFYQTRPGLLTLLDGKNKILYLIKTTSSTTEAKKDNIKIFSETDYAKWFDNVLLFGNDFEISTYDLEKDERELIVRLSYQIKKAIWYPVATHIVYLVADSLKVIELANHQRNLHTLLEKSDIENIFINQRGDKVYFVDEDGVSEVGIQ